MSILTLYPLHKDDVFYLCCKLENTSQTHGSVRSPELIGRNSVVIIVQGLYTDMDRKCKVRIYEGAAFSKQFYIIYSRKYNGLRL